ncbi:hypothetical protein [Pontibacter sp. G13]|uniref:hypothetical protein n=1 Tax=Pontibacter sp. G13 TaxID=3074898 RepID=UPI00288BF19D|nr:hypothetical protein [Pontibacter sp. G13]WNJ20051.1 hypothetical protein RJD25_06165 [Pontibacter sp. G13]
MSNNYPRLFLFCIGGTGSRVMKALTFLLASGVDIKAKEIVPILIDPDQANGDVNRTIEIIKKYQLLHKQLKFDKNQFFKTPIKTLSELSEKSGDGASKKVSRGFRFGISGTKEGKFGDFIRKDQLSPENRALVEALFTKTNLSAELEVGFKGNPHMGSIVLNQFTESDDFIQFSSLLDEGDRIFVVSSIFGGTGAAGFPLLVKNLREPGQNLANRERVKNAPIGAVTVMPYFGVTPSAHSEIDKGTFISKTKAALNYYYDNLSGNDTLNSLYYIGDVVTQDYENNEGSDAQKNKAHLIEFLSATSVLDFMNQPAVKVECEDGRAIDPQYMEYGLNGDAHQVSFANLGKRTKHLVASPLTQYVYANLYWKFNLDNGFPPKQPWTKGFADSFLSGDFFDRDLRQFNKRFWEWLEEMASNERSFNPFNLDTKGGQLHLLIRGVDQEKKFLRGYLDTFEKFDAYLNEACNADDLDKMQDIDRLFSTFSNGTDRLINDRVKF